MYQASQADRKKNPGCYWWKIVYFLSTPKHINGNTMRQCNLCYDLCKRSIFRPGRPIQFPSTRSWRAMIKKYVGLYQISFVLVYKWINVNGCTLKKKTHYTVVKLTTDGAFFNQIGQFNYTEFLDLIFPTSNARQFFDWY